MEAIVLLPLEHFESIIRESYIDFVIIVAVVL